MRGFRSREYVSAPVRVDWLGVCFCRRVLPLLFVVIIIFIFMFFSSFSHPGRRLKSAVLDGGRRFLEGGPGGPGGPGPTILDNIFGNGS